MAISPVIIVTGAAGGIGYEIVRTLVEELNCRVVATDIVEGRLNDFAAKNEGKVEVVVGDVVDVKTSEEIVASAVSKFGQLNGVCLNAGTFGPCYRIAASSDHIDLWSKAFQINVLSHLHVLKYAIPELRKSHGTVVSTTSYAGAQAVLPGWGFYGTSKAAVAFLVKQVHIEEPEITMVGVSPGLCDTNMVRGLLNGSHAGWEKEDAEQYRSLFSGAPVITPEIAGKAYANIVLKVDHALGGLVMDYDDPRLLALVKTE